MASMRSIFLSAAALFCVMFTCDHAQAASSAWDRKDNLSVRLLSAQDAVDDLATMQGGLELDLAKGWHSYWKMPGEGGLAPVFDWSGSSNVKSVTVQWPAPKRFETEGLYSFGYEGDVILPLDIERTDPKKPVTLQMKADIMVCETICIPQSFVSSLVIPVEDKPRNAEEFKVLAAARKALPKAGNNKMRIESAVIGPDALVARIWSQQGYDGADLFADVEGGAVYIVAKPDVTTDEKDPRYASLRIAAPEGVRNLATILMHHNVTLTFIKGKDAVEKRIEF